MGGNWGQGSFKATNWRTGISIIQQEAEREHGREYSGEANCCSFNYCGDKSKLSKAELKNYIQSRQETLYTGSGEVIRLNLEGYEIIKTKIEPVVFLPFDGLYYLRGINKPAILVERNVNGMVFKRSEGTIAELKVKADKQLRVSEYETECYILSKRTSYYCGADRKEVKKTTKVTTDKIMVLPVYTFAYYGWYHD